MKPHCWWCCHSFEWESLHFPYEFSSNTFYTTGHFCSWSCMKAYGIDRGKFEACDFITLMRKRMEGKISFTKSAPKRQTLEMFGGSLSIDDFRSDKTIVNVYIPGEIYKEQSINREDKPLDILKSKQMDSLKLKREKPLERTKGKLETSLGIIRKKCTVVAG